MNKIETIQYLQDLHDTDASLNEDHKKAIEEAITLIRQIKDKNLERRLLILLHILDISLKIPEILNGFR